MSDLDRLRALAKFLPTLEAPDFKAGEMAGLEPQLDGTVTMPYASHNDVANRFVQMLYDEGWISETSNWVEWAQTEEAARLSRDPEALASADVEQLSKLLTAIVRSDRFAEGTILNCFESGQMLRIVRRGRELLRELRSKIPANFISGFVQHGSIEIKNGEIASRIVVPLPTGGVIYMLKQDDEILYIGSAKNDVRGRIASYVNHQRKIAKERDGKLPENRKLPQKKPRAMHGLLTAYLERGPVEVWAMPLDVAPITVFADWPIHMRLGLEHGLICTYKPPLNEDTVKREC